MHFFSKRAVILGVVVSLGFAGSAHAALTDTDDTTIVLGAGDLSVVGPEFSDFTGVDLTGAAAEHLTDVGDWNVSNPGNEGGWEVTMDASDLVDPRGAGTDVTMGGAVLTVAAPEATPDAGLANTSDAPAVAGGNISTGAFKVADAADEDGLGDWTLEQGVDELTLDTPADARAGSYTSTIVTTIAPGIDA